MGLYHNIKDVWVQLYNKYNVVESEVRSSDKINAWRGSHLPQEEEVIGQDYYTTWLRIRAKVFGIELTSKYVKSG